MVKIVLNENKTLEIRNELDEITIGQFEKCLSIFKNDYNLSIDLYLDIISELSNASIDELEELDLDVFMKIIPQVNIQEITEVDDIFSNKIIIDDVTYKTASDGKTYNFNVKQIKHIQTIIKLNQDKYLGDLAAIIFREVKPDGTLGDLSTQSINIRKDLFLNKMMMSTLVPYLLNLSQYFKVEIPKVNEK